MRSPSTQKVALLHSAKDLPKNVERYVQEGLDQGMDESKAWAIAWSRYCKYKEPGSPHCKMDTSEYFPKQKKTASEDHIVRGYLQLLMEKAERVLGYKLKSKGPTIFTAVDEKNGVKVIGKVKNRSLEMYPIDAQSPFELIKKTELEGVPVRDSFFFSSRAK